MTDIVETSEKRSTRDQILDAAEHVVESGGAGRLTIDAVVRESGFSKGGVLYNFPSKAALIEGMIDRMACSVETDAECATARAETGQCKVLGSILVTLLTKDKEKERVRMGLLAAIAEQPELIAPVRRVVDRIKSEIPDHTTDTDLAYILLLAADGLRFSKMMGMDVLTPEEHARVEARMIKLAEEISR